MVENLPDGSAEDLAVVELIGLPLALNARSQEHSQALIREFQLIAEQVDGQAQDGVRAPIPRRLLELVAVLTADYSAYTAEQEEIMDDALAAGEESVDLVYRVPRSAGPAAQMLGELLDEADEFCREGKHLLTLATPPDLVAYRRWYLEEFTRQLAGEPPRPWSAATPGGALREAGRDR